MAWEEGRGREEEPHTLRLRAWMNGRDRALETQASEQLCPRPELMGVRRLAQGPSPGTTTEGPCVCGHRLSVRRGHTQPGHGIQSTECGWPLALPPERPIHCFSYL